MRTRTASYLSDLATLCRDLGGSLIVGFSAAEKFSAGSDDSRPGRGQCHSGSRAASASLECNQVTLALEPLGPVEGNFWNHASQAVEVIQAIGSPWIQLHLDVKAMSTEGQPIDKVIRDNAKWMHHFHANDPNLLGPRYGGSGYGSHLQALKEVNYQGWVSVEVFDYKPGAEFIARESMKNMLAAIEKSN